jgi:zinc/manganese transport system substrate-binding protein
MFRVLAVLAIMAFGAASSRAEASIPVVASFSILADFVRAVGADRVAVTALVGPGGDAHVFTPSPADARTIAAAELVIINGLGFEGWMTRLIASSGSKATVVVATKGIDARPGDPHAWQSVPNAKIYIVNIRDALMAADPQGADVYRANAEAYIAKLDVLDREIRQAIGQLPLARRKVISTHEAFDYFADAYGVTFIAPLGLSTDQEVTARVMAGLIRQIRNEKIPAIFLENIADPRLIQEIAAETGEMVGGTIYSDSLTDENGPAPTYIDMMRHNIKTLTTALSG